jgi:hypothetical protein
VSQVTTWVMAAAGICGALAVVGGVARRVVVGLVQLVTLVRALLELQPRVIHLAEVLADSVEETRQWRADFDRRLTDLETTP